MINPPIVSGNVNLVEVDGQRFSINGIEYFKNFLSVVHGEYISIYNAYDSRNVLASNIHYSDFIINGNTYADATTVQYVILSILYTRDTLGNGGGAFVPDATSTLKGKLKLAGDLGGNADFPTVPALGEKETFYNKVNAILGFENSSTNYPSTKAVFDYVQNLSSNFDLQTCTDNGNLTTNPIVFNGTTIIYGVNKSVVLGAEILPNGDSYNDIEKATIVGVYNEFTGVFSTSRYSKIGIIVPDNGYFDVLKLQNGSTSVNFELSIENFAEDIRLFLKGNVRYDFSSNEFDYKFEWLEPINTSFQAIGMDYNKIRVAFLYDNGYFVLRVYNELQDSFYCNINANIL